MDLLFLLLALAAGVCAPTQAGINSQLRHVAGDPVLAALISFAVGTISLFAYVVLLRVPWPELKPMTQLPWWMWTGGCLGAFLVVVSIVVAPRMGAATMLGVMVAGQMIASLIFDNYGLIGFPEHPTTVWRFVGVVLLVVGVIMIKKF